MLVLALEPDHRQAAILTRVIHERVHAELTLVDSRDGALAAIAEQMPDVILLTALMSPRDEEELFRRLRSLAGSEHVQTHTIPQLAGAAPEPVEQGNGTGVFKRLRKKKAEPEPIAGCDPDVFAQEVSAYLQRAAELRAHAERQPKETRAAAVASAPPLRARPHAFEPRLDIPLPAATAVDAPAAVDTSAWSSPFEWRPASDGRAPLLAAAAEAAPAESSAVADSQEDDAAARSRAEREEAERQRQQAEWLKIDEERRRIEAERREAEAERERLQTAASLQRERLQAEAAAERTRLETEAAAERARLEEEAAAERARLEAEAIADRERREAAELAAREREAQRHREAERLRMEAAREAERARVEAERQAERLRQEAQREKERLRIEGEREAERVRVEAARQTEKMRQLEVARLREEAQQEQNRLREEAQQEKERLRLEAETLRQEADRLRAAAEREAERVRLKAERDADRLRAAAARARAVEERRAQEEADARRAKEDAARKHNEVVEDAFAEFRLDAENTGILRLVPLSLWARIEAPAPAAPEPGPVDDLVEMMKGLSLTPNVATVMYARGCRIRRVRVPAPPADVVNGEAQQPLILSRRTLEQMRSTGRAV